MGNAIESALFGSAPESTAGFKDGLGDRMVVPGSAPGEQLEVLSLRPELTTVSSFEFALRERAARLANFHHESFARVRQIDRVRVPDERLALVSDHVEGWRLSEILAAAHHGGLELDINAALSLVTQLVHAVAVLHQQARGVSHGAIAAERIVVTPRARAVLVEHVLGSALERLDLTRERLWRELRVAVPPAAGGSRFDRRTDVTQLGTVALALVLGRPLGDDDYPPRIADLLATATENHALGERQPLSNGLRAWLARALQLDFRTSFQSAVEAEAALDSLLTAEQSYVAAPVALEAFLALYQRATPREITCSPSACVETLEPQPASQLSAAPSSWELGDEDEGLDGWDGGNRIEGREGYEGREGSQGKGGLESREAGDGREHLGHGAGGEGEQGGNGDEGAVKDEKPAPLVVDTPAASPDPGPGYPGGFESLFGSRLGASATHADEEQGQEQAAGGSGRRSMRVRVAIAATVVIALCAGGYPALGRWMSSKPAVTTGTLSVESQPSGVPLKIDGTPRGVTPLRITLPAGPHKIELETPGEPRVIPITLAAGAQVSQYIEAAAAPVTGRLQITSEPTGAVVFVDGVRKGTAPIVVADLAAGRHRVELQSDAGTAQQEVAVEAGMTNSLIVPLARPSGPASGWVSVNSPVELEVYEGGQLIGTSQSDRILMTAGKHDLDLINETLGFRGRQSVVVAPGKMGGFRVQMPKGALNVNAVPWAEVFIDGERVGETPIGNLALPIGPHEIVFRHPQFGEQRHAITVTMKATARVSVDLRK